MCAGETYNQQPKAKLSVMKWSPTEVLPDGQREPCQAQCSLCKLGQGGPCSVPISCLQLHPPDPSRNIKGHALPEVTVAPVGCVESMLWEQELGHSLTLQVTGLVRVKRTRHWTGHGCTSMTEPSEL